MRRTAPGAPPGTILPDPAAPKPIIRIIAYDRNELVEPADATLDTIAPLLARFPVVWVNIDGLGDAEVIAKIGERFGLHALALEDVVNTHQRPKVEPYADHLYFVAREFMLNERLETDQVSLFLGKNFVVSFQERHGDCFDAVRARLRNPSGHFRSRGPDYLAYALIDAMIDSYFPIVEKMGETIEAIENRVLDRPKQGDMAMLHGLKRDLLQVRRTAWPLREALNSVLRDAHPLITDSTRTYLRDCVDHTIQIIDLVETDREVCSDLRDVYLSSVSNRMNQVMKVLTIISTIFIPLTFLVGVYGMNFDPAAGPLSMPELSWEYGYIMVWGLCIVIAGALMGLFAAMGWMRGSK